MTSLLPNNATSFELAVESAGTLRIEGIDPQVLSTLFNADTCPEQVLTWLAWGFNIEDWGNDWPESVKRERVKVAMTANCIKGTVAAVKKTVEAFGFKCEIVEHVDEPFTFSIFVDTNGGEIPLSQITYNKMLDLVRQQKNVRSHLRNVKGAILGSAYNLTVGAIVHDYIQETFGNIAVRPTLETIIRKYNLDKTVASV